MLRNRDLGFSGYAQLKDFNSTPSGDWIAELNVLCDSKFKEGVNLRIVAVVNDANTIQELSKCKVLMYRPTVILKCRVEFRDFQFQPSNVCKVDSHIIIKGIFISLNEIIHDGMSDLSRYFHSALKIY